MRSLRLVSIPASCAALLTIATLACNPSTSASPSPETAPVAASSEDLEQVPEDETMGEAAEPTSSDLESASDAPSGDVALPPSSAAAWNTAQSDGTPGKADRGIKDYQRIIQDNRDRFRSCYDAALAKRDGIQGRVTLVWVLDPKGAVRDGAHVDADASDFQDEFLEKCMVAALRSLTFPPSARGMDSTVTYPFNFNPRSRAAR